MKAALPLACASAQNSSFFDFALLGVAPVAKALRSGAPAPCPAATPADCDLGAAVPKLPGGGLNVSVVLTKVSTVCCLGFGTLVPVITQLVEAYAANKTVPSIGTLTPADKADIQAVCTACKAETNTLLVLALAAVKGQKLCTATDDASEQVTV